MMNKSGFDFSKNEIRDILIAFTLITVLFAIRSSDEFNQIFYNIPIVMIGIALGFICRELICKKAAMKFNYWSEYKIFTPGIILAFLTSFKGFMFTAPGSVYIYGNANDRENGLICLSGIVVHILFSIVFLGLAILMQSPEIGNSWFNDLLFAIFSMGFLTNGYLAFFGLFPIGSIYGAAIYNWNRILWFIIIAFALFIVWLGTMFFQI